MASAPGSFTKNLGWEKAGSGLRKLYDAIRSGFDDRAVPVSREVWRANVGSIKGGPFVPLNFFLHNTVMNGENFVSVDELVLQALTRPHSAAFDRLALFALNLNRAGDRIGNDVGDAHPSSWAQDFVTNVLWRDGAWRTDALKKAPMDAAFLESVEGVSQQKVSSNYRRLYTLCDYLPAHLDVVNPEVDSWGVAAHFLAWDRRILDQALPSAATVSQLVDAARSDQLHMLLGTTEAYGNQLAADAANLYIEAGRLTRSSASSAQISGIAQSQTDVAVDRKMRMLAQQVRDSAIAQRLKAIYSHRCMICGQALQVSTEPARYFSNAAHIKPLGKPYNGPDRDGNILILCPNHHVQFDEGILRLARVGNRFRIQSKIINDPLHGRNLAVNSSHMLDPTLVSWHFNFHHGAKPR
jgi:hypothetical protein